MCWASMWQIEFTASKFLPYLPESCQANPGVYGFELAHWLSKELAARDVVTSYSQGEDWGWFVDYERDGVEVMICCSSMTEMGEASSGQPIAWTIFIKPMLSLPKKLKRISADSVVQFLSRHISELLKQE